MRQGMMLSSSGILFDPELGLTLTKTHSPLVPIDGGDLDNDLTTFAADVVFPTTLSPCCLYEIGASGIGSFVGLHSSTEFIARMGNGGSSSGTPDDNKAEVIFDVTAWQGRTVTIVWEFNAASGNLTVWFNGKLVATTNSVNSGIGIGGGDSGTYGGALSGVPNGCSNNDWAGSIVSPLRQYNSQLVNRNQ